MQKKFKTFLGVYVQNDLPKLYFHSTAYLTCAYISVISPPELTVQLLLVSIDIRWKLEGVLGMCVMGYRIIEYAVLEVTHQDHRVPTPDQVNSYWNLG